MYPLYTPYDSLTYLLCIPYIPPITRISWALPGVTEGADPDLAAAQGRHTRFLFQLNSRTFEVSRWDNDNSSRVQAQIRNQCQTTAVSAGS